MSGRSQAVRIPKAFQLSGNRVTIRRSGTALLLEPFKESHDETLPKTPWTKEFLDSIKITDPAFKRYPQGEMPPAPIL